MATSSFKATERKSDRLEAFMDAVLAIAITLPVTELHAPEPTDGDLAAAYLKLAPEYAAYALSVILIGLYWTSSHTASFCKRPIMATICSASAFLRLSAPRHFLRGRSSSISAVTRKARPPFWPIWAWQRRRRRGGSCVGSMQPGGGFQTRA